MIDFSQILLVDSDIFDIQFNLSLYSFLYDLGLLRLKRLWQHFDKKFSKIRFFGSIWENVGILSGLPENVGADIHEFIIGLKGTDNDNILSGFILAWNSSDRSSKININVKLCSNVLDEAVRMKLFGDDFNLLDIV